MTETMLEKAALALKTSHDVECGELGITMDEKTAMWLTRAVLLAIREPDEAMIDAQWKAGELRPCNSEAEAKALFRDVL